MAGYSNTPLLKKLGIQSGLTLTVINEPAQYWNWLSPLPAGVRVVANQPNTDLIHLFVTGQKEFEQEFLKVKRHLSKQGALWVSWPKKSSKRPTDLDENKIRNFGLGVGLVDVKVCAVDETWSGLKFVYRLKDR